MQAKARGCAPGGGPGSAEQGARGCLELFEIRRLVGWRGVPEGCGEISSWQTMNNEGQSAAYSGQSVSKHLLRTQGLSYSLWVQNNVWALPLRSCQATK